MSSRARFLSILVVTLFVVATGDLRAGELQRTLVEAASAEASSRMT